MPKSKKKINAKRTRAVTNQRQNQAVVDVLADAITKAIIITVMLKIVKK